MKAEAYIEKVLFFLQMPENEKERVRSDLQSDFAAAMENGETEEEIISRMGQPEQLAQELNQNRKAVQPHGGGKSSILCGKIIAIVSGILAVAAMLLYIIPIGMAAVSPNDISIIGGADLPTEIFIMERVSNSRFLYLAGILVALVFVGVGIMLYGKYKQKK